MNQLSVQTLAAWLADDARAQPLLLDVREPWEVQTAAIPGVLNIPMQEIPSRVAELDAGREIVSICHHGSRSMQVALFLERQGLTMHNLAGGIDAWSREIDPAVPRY
jgi:rhodanese-related sulfurtransferase